MSKIELDNTIEKIVKSFDNQKDLEFFNYILFGLGNGQNLRGTYHNIGSDIIQELICQIQNQTSENSFIKSSSIISILHFDNIVMCLINCNLNLKFQKNIWLIYSNSPMINESGTILSRALRFLLTYKVSSQNNSALLDKSYDNENQFELNELNIELEKKNNIEYFKKALKHTKIIFLYDNFRKQYPKFVINSGKFVRKDHNGIKSIFNLKTLISENSTLDFISHNNMKEDFIYKQFHNKIEIIDNFDYLKLRKKFPQFPISLNSILENSLCFGIGCGDGENIGDLSKRVLQKRLNNIHDLKMFFKIFDQIEIIIKQNDSCLNGEVNNVLINILNTKLQNNNKK